MSQPTVAPDHSLPATLQRAVRRYGPVRAVTKVPRSARRRIGEQQAAAQARREEQQAAAQARRDERRRTRPHNQAEAVAQRAGFDLDEVLLVSDRRWGTQLLRKQTTDWPTYQQVFNAEEYAFEHEPAPRRILDLGANVGYSAIYYHRRFPQAQIIAVEPSAANAAAARANIALAGADRSITVVESAIWPSVTHLAITNPDANAWAFRVAEVEAGTPGSFPASTVPSLMRRFDWDRIDLVKIDIEAAERFLFARDTEWLARVEELVIELHDRFTPGCRAPVIEAMERDFGRWTELVQGENTLFRRVSTTR